MTFSDGHVMTQLVHVTQVGLVAAACGWFADRTIGSERPGWIIPVVSGIAGLYLGPWIAVGLGWQWGPSFGDVPVLPILLGAVVACLFVKLLTLGLATHRR